MGTTAFLAINQWRRQWPSLVALVVLVALAGGVAMAAVAGARRSATSMDRFIAASRPPDLMIATAPGAADELEGIADLEGVADVAPLTLFAALPEADLGEVFFPMMASLDGAIPERMYRPRVLSGRLPDPDQPHEVALGERVARQLGATAGDRLPMLSATPADLQNADGFPEPTGPAFDLDVVGIVRDPFDVAGNETDVAITVLTPAFAAEYDGEIGVMAHLAMVSLTDDSALEAFTAAVRRHGGPVEVQTFANEGADPVGSTLGVIATSLYVVAVVVAAVSGFALAQTLARRVGRSIGDDRSLRAVGASRRMLLARTVLPVVVVAAAGAAGAVGIAVAASPLFPIGLARRAEPEPGVQVDALVVGAGGLIVLLSVVGLAVAADVVVRRSGRRGSAGNRRASPLSRTGSPVLLAGLVVPWRGLGTALRSARLAVAVGVAGVVGVVTFATSMDHLLATPDLYGVGWDAGLAPDERSGMSGQAVLADSQVDAVAADDAVAEARRAVFQIEADVEGVPVFLIGVGDGTGSIGPVTSAGRAPRAPGEVVLAVDTLQRIGRRVGDSVGIDAGRGVRTFEIVGQAVAPVSRDGGSLTEGGAMTVAGAERLGAFDDEGGCGSEGCYQQVVVRWREGADVPAALARLVGDEGAREWIDQPPPAGVLRLNEVEGVPWVLALLLAGVGAGATAHALAVVTRHRRRELGVLRTLGFTPGQVRSALAVQATAIGAIGVVLGLVGGVVLGRTVWRLVAESTGVVAEPVVPVAALAAVAAAALVLAHLAAAGPTIGAGRLHPAEILRSE